MMEEYFYLDGKTLVSAGRHANLVAAIDRIDMEGKIGFMLASRTDWEKMVQRIAEALRG